MTLARLKPRPRHSLRRNGWRPSTRVEHRDQLTSQISCVRNSAYAASTDAQYSVDHLHLVCRTSAGNLFVGRSGSAGRGARRSRWHHGKGRFFPLSGLGHTAANWQAESCLGPRTHPNALGCTGIFWQHASSPSGCCKRNSTKARSLAMMQVARSCTEPNNNQAQSLPPHAHRPTRDWCSRRAHIPSWPIGSVASLP